VDPTVCLQADANVHTVADTLDNPIVASSTLDGVRVADHIADQILGASGVPFRIAFDSAPTFRELGLPGPIGAKSVATAVVVPLEYVGVLARLDAEILVQRRPVRVVREFRRIPQAVLPLPLSGGILGGVRFFLELRQAAVRDPDARAQLLDVHLLVRQRTGQRVPVGERRGAEPDLLQPGRRRHVRPRTLFVQEPDLVRVLDDADVDSGQVDARRQRHLSDQFLRTRHRVPVTQHVQVRVRRIVVREQPGPQRRSTGGATALARVVPRTQPTLDRLRPEADRQRNRQYRCEGNPRSHETRAHQTGRDRPPRGSAGCRGVHEGEPVGEHLTHCATRTAPMRRPGAVGVFVRIGRAVVLVGLRVMVRVELGIAVGSGLRRGIRRGP